MFLIDVSDFKVSPKHFSERHGLIFIISLGETIISIGIGAAGLPGIVKVKGLAAIYMSVLRVWLNDDSEDMAKTMSALDRALRRAECIIGLCRFPSRWKAHAETEPEAGSA